MYEYEATIIELISSAIRSIKVLPLVLGGVTDSGGGSGGPPGGFVGQLPQVRIAYDTDEFSDPSTPASGMSILDNLNHIRYRITSIEIYDVIGTEDKTCRGQKTDLVAGVDLDFGDVCFMQDDGKMEKNDASSSTTCRGWVLAEEEMDEDDEGRFLLTGFVNNSDWNWSNIGGYIYADPLIPGGMTQVLPSGSLEIIQILGIATSQTGIYFKPELAQVEHL